MFYRMTDWVLDRAGECIDLAGKCIDLVGWLIDVFANVTHACAIGVWTLILVLYHRFRLRGSNFVIVVHDDPNKSSWYDFFFSEDRDHRISLFRRHRKIYVVLSMSVVNKVFIMAKLIDPSTGITGYVDVEDIEPLR